MSSFFASCWREAKDLLYWSMLAASTVGPGTVIVCSKSGADFGLSLVWTLLVASFVAFTLQEGAARLSLVSGKNLGAAMRQHFFEPKACSRLRRLRRRGLFDPKTPVVCFVMAVGVVVGNTAYQANNFAGASGALETLGVPAQSDALWRTLLHALLSLLVASALLFGNVDRLSNALGVVVLLMVATFGAAAVAVGAPAAQLGRGLFVPAIPSSPSGGGTMALSMMGTTAIPFNTFLASAMKGSDRKLASMQRGIAVSTALAGLLSLLVVIAGTAVSTPDDDNTNKTSEDYSLERLADALRETEGGAAVFSFAIGLYAAAYSSALAVGLGAALCAQTLLADEGAPILDAVSSPKAAYGPVWHGAGMAYRGVLLTVVAVAFVVGASGLPPLAVVFTAQVVNGTLLPFVALALALCSNDPALVRSSPPSLGANCAMLLTVLTTIFLSAHVVLDALFGSLDGGSFAAQVLAGVVAVASAVPLFFVMRAAHYRSRQMLSETNTLLSAPTTCRSEDEGPPLVRHTSGASGEDVGEKPQDADEQPPVQLGLMSGAPI